MNLAEKSQAVSKLFEKLGEEANQFASESGLGCVAGCGACCANPKVSASPLEFLPLAFDFFNKGLADTILNLLDSDEEGSACIVYRAHSADGKKGYCTNYANRGMICRLFAAAARKNKYGSKELIICKILKEEKSEKYQLTTQRINQDMGIPNAAKYYMLIEEIDDQLAQQHPINTAIKLALELVLRYKFYQEGELLQEL
ncbi:MAG: YkgJ family cysteine cluster protein [Algoriphagus sp.]|uniref:YkgJ family cysteine cluster protein n=1 Tax=Algoriphagus sp. TaxID=1872435 RepID=UPI00261697D6|nr:YkgJ family cysteine cluster protein [Algoriphagus sp.]MDG1277105.1 YkgJ family cysteine cluster protein [Algoriphagus sp.]